MQASRMLELPHHDTRDDVPVKGDEPTNVIALQSENIIFRYSTIKPAEVIACPHERHLLFIGMFLYQTDIMLTLALVT